jgi:hypothetical protein
MSIPAPVNVVVTYTDEVGDTQTETRVVRNAVTAFRLAMEESKWEKTLRVDIPEYYLSIVDGELLA